MVQEVFDKTERLEDFPQSGRIPPELPNSVYKEVVVPPCRIFYREDEKRVLVLYVMREERQLRAYMLGTANQARHSDGLFSALHRKDRRCASR
ncbi:type II toxin-antitoxin system RelE/ParE family toxin [Marinobacter sp.]|uniref:type II toxin-antitoxin system RelE/ParE family toxin n=1 Tax=Marinobacter sp. TaxID=50741 RepID=UPI002B4935A3|nr:type II toxin-antitoxin system RelE/ParE family toxin [Marinobacter sp.]HKK57788.1 type II toxin-antitoxin system RelE/ParE family toxin [Marinobacter sp.]